uniref:[histone H4]-N-methyl-L-lysine(20) N-methyltransferase n=1 Tax=Panagrellus redivivus TaxID=6233 RepID=A0A7E4W1V1_PANRE
MSNSKLVLNTKEFSLLYHHFLQRTNGRNTMSARELCEIDDLCTTLVVDPLVRFKSHKMDLNYQPPDMQTHLLCLSIMLQFIYDGDIMKVYRGLYSLKYTQEFLENRDVKARDHVRDHLLRFIAMFRHDAGYTIVPCSRYGHEGNVGGKLISTKYWKKGEQMTLLIGVIGNMTLEEEAELLVVGENDFSVLMSQRTMRPQLWLGPGAFLNHDCNPNCEFLSNKTNTAVVTVVRDINPGDELFIHYGPTFFGENNELCECSTCESRQTGAFAPRGNEEGGTNAKKRPQKRGFSPTPSMFSTYTLDAEGNAIYKRALRARKQVTVEEMIFDSVTFFQEVVLDRFVEKPLIIGTENVSNLDDYPVLKELRFEPKGIPNIEVCTATDLMTTAAENTWNELTGEDFDPTPIMKHFPEPPATAEDLTPTNLLTFLGLNVCVMEQMITRSGRAVDKKLAISSSRPWDTGRQAKPWRNALRVKRKTQEGAVVPRFVSQKDFSRLHFEQKSGKFLKLSNYLAERKLQEKIRIRGDEVFDTPSRSVSPAGSISSKSSVSTSSDVSSADDTEAHRPDVAVGSQARYPGSPKKRTDPPTSYGRPDSPAPLVANTPQQRPDSPAPWSHSVPQTPNRRPDSQTPWKRANSKTPSPAGDIPDSSSMDNEARSPSPRDDSPVPWKRQGSRLSRDSNDSSIPSKRQCQRSSSESESSRESSPVWTPGRKSPRLNSKNGPR